MTISLKTISPESCDTFLVGTEIPGITIYRILTSNMAIFLTMTKTRFMMREPHHNSELICKFCTGKSRTILCKAGGPHGRPHIVTLHTKKHFEDSFVGLYSKSTEVLRAPITKCWPFIIYKETSISYRWFL